MQASLPDTHNDLRAAPRALCAQFAPEYHRQHAGREPGRGVANELSSAIVDGMAAFSGRKRYCPSTIYRERVR